MSKTNQIAPGTTSPSLLRRAIEVCDRFEADWRADRPSSLEAYLEKAPSEDRRAVFQMLLGLEVELRRARGEKPTPQEYLNRFPEEATRVEMAFREIDSAPELEEAAPQEVASDQYARPTVSWLASAVEQLLMPTDSSPAGCQERYTLIRLLAEGGFGQVWLARDRELGREIALKRLRSGTATSLMAQARFLREARVTGQLQHPGIAPVYDLARTVDGQESFYTMRFISGRTMSQAAREYHGARKAGNLDPLALRELLAAFVGICQVIAYAHSHGVIHRDLKGNNIALGEYGEVMVLDWGLAKVLGESETDGSHTPQSQAQDQSPGQRGRVTATGDDDADSDHETAWGEILGTPSYMSPEQAMGRPDLVTYASDIYGLGAILYEILTGRPPYRGRKHEVLRKVVDEPPEPPRALVPDIPAALSSICMKCLEKAPESRYASAADLAKDVQLYLADEPVTAFQEPWATKARRWLSRHRTLAVASTATLLVGTVILSIALVSLQAARKKAERNLGVAKQAVDRSLTAFADDPRLRAVGLEQFRREILALATNFYEIFAQEQSGDPRLEVERGNQFVNYAKITEELGEASESVPLSQRACSIFEALVRREPTSLEYWEGLARARDSLGGNYNACHQPSQARAALESVVKIWQRLATEHPGRVEYRYQTAVSLNRLARILWFGLKDSSVCEQVLGQSLPLCQRLVTERPDRPEHRNEHAQALLLTGKVRSSANLSEAERLFEQALSIREQLAAAEPDNLEYQSNLVDTCVLIAADYSNARKPDQVKALYAKVREISRRMAREHPDVARFAENHSLIEIPYWIMVAQSGGHERATTEVEAVLEKTRASGMSLIYAVCCYCVAGESAQRDERLPTAERPRRALKYQDRAMELLRAAAATGLFREPFRLRGVRDTDPDIAPLRHREDFQKLIRELEAQMQLPAG
jgi:serine/threonine protein kinase